MIVCVLDQSLFKTIPILVSDGGKVIFEAEKRSLVVLPDDHMATISVRESGNRLPNAMLDDMVWNIRALGVSRYQE
ncbi:hypothetical protein A5676_04415 [Mycobacterium malmoense]|nr:hypothetical protein A5676_04415 [Mycobacterium malmoense]